MSTTRTLLLSFVALAGLLVVIGMMAGVFRDRIEPGLLEQGSPEQGDVYVVERSMVAAMEPVPASVEARDTTIVASRLLARVETVSVRAGDYVEQGQVLATLDQRDLEARVRQAQEGLRAVEARLTEAQQSLAPIRRQRNRHWWKRARRCPMPRFGPPWRVASLSALPSPVTPCLPVPSCCRSTIPGPCAWRPGCGSPWR